MVYRGKKIYEEAPEAADGYRSAYVRGISAYILDQQALYKRKREAFMTPKALQADPEYFRKLYLEMIGLDALPAHQTAKPEITFVGNDDICSIYRLVAYPVAQVPFYAMLLIPHEAKMPMPLVITQHGGGGTPELCCDMNGKNNYSHMVQRVLERGAAALAPQLLLWAQTELETARAHPVAYDRGRMDWELKRFGTSMTALEIAGIQRCLDFVLDMEQIDSERVGMIGLSYGGYFAMHTMAADTRILAGYSAGAFNDRDFHSKPDWSYPGSAAYFQDAEVAALCAPRKLYVQTGKEDPVFDYLPSVAEAERVKPYYEAFGCPENFVFDLWEGGHRVSDHDRGYDFLFSVLREKE